jgi:hypothetical protein
MGHSDLERNLDTFNDWQSEGYESAATCEYCDTGYVACPECGTDDEDVLFGGTCPTCLREGHIPCPRCNLEEHEEFMRASGERGGFISR